MNITNKYAIPEEFVRAVLNDNTCRDYYSPSMIHDPPRRVHLMRRHWDEMEEDVIDSLWKLFGTAVHKVIEDSNDPEMELEADFGNHKLRGKVDLYKAGSVKDWKVTSAWTIVFENRFIEWSIQTNVYKRLLEKSGYPVNGIEVWAILRDWSETKAMRDSDYPQLPIYCYTPRIGKPEDVDKYIIDRIDLFKKYESVSDDELPFCTGKEQWRDPEKWAVYEKGKKRASKLHLVKEDADQHAERVNGTIEHRIAKPSRCLKYCPANKFCNQFREEVLNGRNQNPCEDRQG